MYFIITLNGIDFEIWASNVITAVKSAIKQYSKNNPFWEGVALVNGEKFKNVVCLGN